MSYVKGIVAFFFVLGTACLSMAVQYEEITGKLCGVPAASSTSMNAGLAMEDGFLVWHNPNQQRIYSLDTSLCFTPYNTTSLWKIPVPLGTYATNAPLTLDYKDGMRLTYFAGYGVPLGAYVIDEEDEPLWQKNTGTGANNGSANSFAISGEEIGDKIVILGLDHYLYGLDPLYGDYGSAWKGPWWMINGQPGSPVQIFAASASPVVGPDGTLYQMEWYYKLYAVNPDTGEIKWRCDLPCDGETSTTPVIGSNGKIYVAYRKGKIYEVDPELAASKCAISSNEDEEAYSLFADLPDFIYRTPVIGIKDQADDVMYVSTVDRDGIYLNFDDGWLYAIDMSNGEQLGYCPMASGGAVADLAVAADGTIITDGWYDTYLLQAFYPFSEERWESEPKDCVKWTVDTPGNGTGGSAYGGIVIDDEGYIYASTFKGEVFVIAESFDAQTFKPVVPLDSGPLADTPWPTFQHDNARTGRSPAP